MAKESEFMVCYVVRSEGPFSGHNKHERVTLDLKEAEAARRAGLVEVHAGPFVRSVVEAAGGMSAFLSSLEAQVTGAEASVIETPKPQKTEKTKTFKAHEEATNE